MTIDPVDAKRNEIYRRVYPKLLTFIIILSVIASVLSLILAYSVITKKQPPYYAALSNGSIEKMYSFSEPVLSSSYILSYSSKVARTALTLNFNSYEKQLSKLKPLFTSQAWNQLQDALGRSGYIDTLVDSKLIMSAYVRKNPTIVARGVSSRNQYFWRVLVPVGISYEGASQVRQGVSNVQLTLVRYPSVQNPNALLVSTINIL